MRLYYLETILPIVRKINFALAVDTLVLNVKRILQIFLPYNQNLRDSAAYYTSLVNGGIITPNEAREALGL